MKVLYKLTMSLLLLTIVCNIYFLFHTQLFHSLLSIVLHVSTLVLVLLYLVFLFLKKKRLKEKIKRKLQDHYTQLISKN